MKIIKPKLILSVCTAGILLVGCDTVPEVAGVNKSNTENKTSEMLPYFEFNDESGVWYPESETGALKKAVPTKVVADTAEFYALLEDVNKKINNDNEYKKSIPRPLDYLCPLPILGLWNEHPEVTLENGDVLFNETFLREKCEFIGLDCETCDESAEEDPYLSQPQIAKRAQGASEISPNGYGVAEIYPYRLYGNTFIRQYALYWQIGAENQFKKRERVWRGLSGMVWRWVDFNPNRAGIRSYCFEGGTYINSSSDAESDSWYNFSDYMSEACSEAGAVSLPSGYFGVIGMHYARHGDRHFYVQTRTNVSDETYYYTGYEYRQ